MFLSSRHLRRIRHYRPQSHSLSTFFLACHLWNCSTMAQIIAGFYVKASNHTSQPLSLSCGIVLGPLLFILYTTTLSHLKESLSVDHHLYADDIHYSYPSPLPLFPPQSHTYSLL